MQEGIATPPPPASRFWLVAAFGAALVALGLGAAHYMEVEGHIVTGMNNHVVWGLPHVFAIFLIVAASGVLNVASIGSVFGKAVYKARAPLSGLLCLAMLAGGLMVLMLDLGRPDRLIVAATHYNFTSMFAWNVFLYSGMAAIVAVYLWTLMERRMNPYSKKAGLAAFIWRLVLTTGTGSIFGFLVARQAYGSALLAPMFIVMSFAWGLAVFLLAQAAVYAWNRMTLPADVSRRMTRLLGVFVAATLYLVAAHHLTNLYFARQFDFERFILVDGGVYTLLFWVGYVAVGSVVPLLLVFGGDAANPRNAVTASVLVIAGAFCALYVFIIGGQAFPLELFPGAVTRSTFYDGQIAPYAPSLPELLLGIGGVATAFLITTIGVHVLDFLPRDPAPATGAASGGG
ncbi:MAG: polysulfide reductase NrfD [Burkholderiaceae bacterium]|jgi:molybdopterin-containing oxidoreductase family membrane subunit|nr:polysulfide reductase NrfD [Burkholderiaceae bacterium]